MTNIILATLGRFSSIAWTVWADRFAFERTVPTFQLTVALWIVRTGSHMRHAAVANELFEVTSDELWAVVADDPWCYSRMFFQGRLAHDFNVNFRHRFTQLVMHDISAVTIKHGDQIEERSARIDVRNINVPVLMRLQRLVETVALLRLLWVLSLQTTGGVENPINRCW